MWMWTCKFLYADQKSVVTRSCGLFTVAGLLCVRQSLKTHQPVDELKKGPFTLQVQVLEYRKMDGGVEVDVHLSATSRTGSLVWESVMTLLSPNELCTASMSEFVLLFDPGDRNRLNPAQPLRCSASMFWQWRQSTRSLKMWSGWSSGFPGSLACRPCGHPLTSPPVGSWLCQPGSSAATLPACGCCLSAWPK